VVLRTAQKAASSTIPVLVEGESGVGKELFARAIHGSGERKSKPFVAVNCGAIPDNLVESILFGHEKGRVYRRKPNATPAIRRSLRRHAVSRRSLRIAADSPGQAASRATGRRGRGGWRAQAGEGRPCASSPRTNRKLLGARQKRTFPREDLFYRLHVLPLTVPLRCGCAARTSRICCDIFSQDSAPKKIAPSPRHQQRGDDSHVAARVAPAISVSLRTRFIAPLS